MSRVNRSQENHRVRSRIWDRKDSPVAFIGAFLILCLFGAFLYWAFKYRAPKYDACEVEATQLFVQLKEYESNQGCLPEVDVLAHLKKIYKPSDISKFDQFLADGPSLEDFDEKEVIAFWLTDQGIRQAMPASRRYLITNRRMFIDSDGDGWPEFVNSKGQVFVLEEGDDDLVDRLMVLEPESGAKYTAPLSERYIEKLKEIEEAREDAK